MSKYIITLESGEEVPYEAKAGLTEKQVTDLYNQETLNPAPPPQDIAQPSTTILAPVNVGVAGKKKEDRWSNLIFGQHPGDTAARIAANVGGAIDLPIHVGNYLNKKIEDYTGFPTKQLDPPVGTVANRVLDYFNIPKDSSGYPEGLANAIAQTGFGIGGVGPAVSKIAPQAGKTISAMPGMQLTGTVAGSAASEAAKKAELPPEYQVGLGLLAGVAAPGLLNLPKAALNATKHVINYDPYAPSIPDRTAAKIFQGAFGDPQTAEKRLRQYVDLKNSGESSVINIEGSPPITQEIVRDVNLPSMGRAFKLNPRAVELGYGNLHEDRIYQANRAINQALNEVNYRDPNRVPGLLKDLNENAPKAGGNLDAITTLKNLVVAHDNKFREGKPLGTTEVDATEISKTIDKMVEKNASYPETVGFLKEIKKSLGAEPYKEDLWQSFRPRPQVARDVDEASLQIAPPKPSLKTNFERLWDTRKYIYEKLYPDSIDTRVPDSRTQRHKRLGGEIAHLMNTKLEGAFDDFGDLLGRQKKLFDQIDALTAGRKMQDDIRSSRTLPSTSPDLDDPILNSYSSGNTNKKTARLTNVEGEDSELAKALTQKQKDVFKKVNDGLQQLDSLNYGIGSISHSPKLKGSSMLSDQIANELAENFSFMPGSNSKLHKVSTAALAKTFSGLDKFNLLHALEDPVLTKLAKAYLDPEEALGLLSTPTASPGLIQALNGAWRKGRGIVGGASQAGVKGYITGWQPPEPSTGSR